MKDKNLHIILAITAMALLIGFTMALAEDIAAPAAADHPKTPTFVGTKGCKTCHQGEKNGKIYETWMDSKHAKAFSALDSAKGETTNPKCLKCHTTGYGNGGYGTKGMETIELAGVQCEACHGAGSEYKSLKVMKDKKAALAAGLVIPTEETCKKCHNAESPNFKSFDFKEACAKIEHKLPPKPVEGTTPATPDK